MKTFAEVISAVLLALTVLGLLLIFIELQVPPAAVFLVGVAYGIMYARHNNKL